MSLPLRLTLAFLALASLVAIVAFASFTGSQRLETAVSELNRQDGIDLRHVDLPASWLEIEGFWNPEGRFVADAVEIHPGHRFPSLRGAIQSIDREQRTITLFGTAIAIREDTRFVQPGAIARFEDFAVGQRVEVDSEIEGRRWIAREIESEKVKNSDKIKATVTDQDLDGKPPELVRIDDLEIEIQSSTDHAPASALGRIETAARMETALHECLAFAYALVAAPKSVRSGESVGTDESGNGAAKLLADPRLRLEHALADFEYHLDRAELADASGAAKHNLARLNERRAELRESIGKLLASAAHDRASARAYLDQQVAPLLQEVLIPHVNDYLSHAQKSLEGQLIWIVDNSHWTTQFALLIGIAAAIAAVLVAVLVWRSITLPVRVLHAAALRIGEGHLDTRVELHSRDEIGVLASAFNKMASELEASTVSVDKLQSVFDSMAAALVILSPDGRVSNANAAAARMLRYSHAELLELRYDQFCTSFASGAREDASEAANPLASVLAGTERSFLRKDGTRFPVSFSATELRSSPDAPLRGYVCVAQDLSLIKHIEERLRGSLAEKELLLREVHHRVKNNLQIICSMLALQAAEIEDSAVREPFEQSESRIRSMALIHDQLYENAGAGNIPMRAYLERLAGDLARSLRRRGGVALSVECDDITLDIDRSLACGLIVSELVTKSIASALATGSEQRVAVELARESGGRCRLRISGVDLAAPSGDGTALRSGAFAMNLIEALAKQLRASERTTSADQRQLEIVFPLDDPAEAAA
jgi:PAS domain S-box-containing protein